MSQHSSSFQDNVSTEDTQRSLTQYRHSEGHLLDEPIFNTSQSVIIRKKISKFLPEVRLKKCFKKIEKATYFRITLESREIFNLFINKVKEWYQEGAGTDSVMIDDFVAQVVGIDGEEVVVVTLKTESQTRVTILPHIFGSENVEVARDIKGCKSLKTYVEQVFDNNSDEYFWAKGNGFEGTDCMHDNCLSAFKTFFPVIRPEQQMDVEPCARCNGSGQCDCV